MATDPPASDASSGTRTTAIDYAHSPSLAEVLRKVDASCLISTYQAGLVVALGVTEDALHLSMNRFDRAMGVAVAADQVAVGGREQVWFLNDHSDLAPRLPPQGAFDRCLLPRRTSVTGPIQVHEMAWGEGADGEPSLWMVNTLFSCLAGIDEQHSFVPRWRPPFISALAAEDRCHLNGMAMREGRPAFVTVMATTDTAGGWRRDRNNTGAVLHVPSGEVVTRGLAMPHSPRWYDGALYVLNSGWGRLERVDLTTGSRDVVALLPGYARGLAISNGIAFVGLSRIRESAVFGGVPIAEYHEQLRCGLGVVDLSSGQTIATLQFTSGIEEIFDVQLMPGARNVALGGSEPDDHIWLLPGSAR